VVAEKRGTFSETGRRAMMASSRQGKVGVTRAVGQAKGKGDCYRAGNGTCDATSVRPGGYLRAKRPGNAGGPQSHGTEEGRVIQTRRHVGG